MSDAVHHELSFVVDLKHGLALFSGNRSEIEDTFLRIGRGCKKLGSYADFESNVRVVSSPTDVDESEVSYMLKHLRVPRRVSIRLRNRG